MAKKQATNRWNIPLLASALNEIDAFQGKESTRYRAGNGRKRSARCEEIDMICGGNENSSHLLQDNRSCSNHERLRLLDKHLPSLRCTVEALVNLVLSQNLETLNKPDVEKLNRFLDSENLEHRTNRDVITQGLSHVLIYGRGGFRWLSERDGIVFHEADRYSIIYQENPQYLGFNEILGYVVSRPDYDTPFGESHDVTHEEFEIDFLNGYGFNDQYLYFTESQFYNLYFYGNNLYSDTPLNHDIDRIELFISLIANMVVTINSSNKDINLVKLAENLFSMTSKQASDLVAQSNIGKETQEKAIAKQVTNFANVVTSATGQESLIVPPMVSEFEQLGAKVDIQDFLDLYNHIETFISKLYGLSSNVLTLENMPRDASANPIFEQMMKTSIYPKRTVVTTFLNKFIGSKLGLSEIRFEEESYAFGMKLQNAQSYATVIATLHNADVILDDAITTDFIENKLLKGD